MSENISHEFYFFLHAALTGVILSVVYDVFRIVRRVHTHGCLWIAIEDFCYWLCSALYMFYVLMKENNGVIRWFFIIGILLGMLVYNFTISPYIVGVLSKFIRKTLDILEKIVTIILKPWTFLWKKAKKFLQKIGKIFKKALKKCYKTIKIGLRKK